MIALGCDHGGYELMQEVIKCLEEHGLEYKNYGTYSTDSCDYPDYAKKVAEAILAGECEKGILICGTGIGITIAANRYEGIRAANFLTYQIKYRNFSIKPELRYWPSRKNHGFFAAAHGGMAYFNFAFDGKYRWQSHSRRTPALGGGLNVGFRTELGTSRH